MLKLSAYGAWALCFNPVNQLLYILTQPLNTTMLQILPEVLGTVKLQSHQNAQTMGQTRPKFHGGFIGFLSPPLLLSAAFPIPMAQFS